jgi:hypothetical protein
LPAGLDIFGMSHLLSFVVKGGHLGDPGFQLFVLIPRESESDDRATDREGGQADDI